MKSFDLIVFIAAFAIVGIRLYQKYSKKNKGDDKATAASKGLFGKKTFKEVADDYEPYSKSDKGELQ